jgi:hypothetical protein
LEGKRTVEGKRLLKGKGLLKGKELLRGVDRKSALRTLTQTSESKAEKELHT